jgi:hypothetical protein
LLAVRLFELLQGRAELRSNTVELFVTRGQLCSDLVVFGRRGLVPGVEDLDLGSKGLILGLKGLVLGSNGSELTGEIRTLTTRYRGRHRGGTRMSRMSVKSVEEISLVVSRHCRQGRFHDVLDEKLVIAGLAPNMVTSVRAADTQRSRTCRANHGDPIDLVIAGLHRAWRKLLGGGRFQQVRSQGAKLVFAMLAADVVAAVRMLDPKANQAVGANRHEVLGHLAHGTSSADTGADSRELRGRTATLLWRTVAVLDLCQEDARISTGK